MSSPGSAARLALFRLTGTHCCCSTWGFGFHPSLSTGVCAIAAVYFKAISPMTQFHRFLVSLHMHDNPTYSFGFLPVPCVHCCGFRDYGTPQRSTHVCNRILQASSTSANNPLGQKRQYSWQVNELACFSGPFVPCFFLGISWQYDSAPSTLLSGAVASAMFPTGQAEKTLQWRESPISCV